MGCPGGSGGKESTCNAGNPGSVPGSGRSLGEGNGYFSSTLAWRIPWTEENSWRAAIWASQMVKLVVKNLSACILQYSCLENAMDGGAWQAAMHGVALS